MCNDAFFVVADVGVGFVEQALNVTEGDGSVQVCVEMTGYTAVPLSVSISTRPGTAAGNRYTADILGHVSILLLSLFAAGTDFLQQTVSLEIPVTEQSILDAMFSLPVPQRLNNPLPTSPPICTSFSIVDDDILELQPSKQFLLNLSHPDPAVSLIQPLTAVVTVTDDDSKLNQHLTPEP